MKPHTPVLASISLALPLAVVHFSGSTPSAPPTTTAEPALPHCQIPCGIYGDKMRIAMLEEDLATIEKGMKKLQKSEQQEAPEQNQLVRWILNKDQHAQAIQDQVAAYWLAQRIKAPTDGKKDTYYKQLEMMHGITVAAMKCKQTTDTKYVEEVRKLAAAFSETYFSKEDLEHIKSHHDH